MADNIDILKAKDLPRVNIGIDIVSTHDFKRTEEIKEFLGTKCEHFGRVFIATDIHGNGLGEYTVYWKPLEAVRKYFK